MLGWHLVLVTLYRGLQVVPSKTIRIVDNKYILFSVVSMILHQLRIPWLYSCGPHAQTHTT